MFEELDDEHQVEFLRERSDEEVAEVLSRMASDDAADLLLEIEQDRRLPVLNLLPAAKQRKIKGLLGYNPSTAGGLMNPDFVSLRAGADGQPRRSIACAPASSAAQHSSIVCVTEADDGTAGRRRMSLAELVRADPDAVACSSLIDGAARRPSRPRPTCPRWRG